MTKCRVEILEDFTDIITKQDMVKGKEAIYNKDRAEALTSFKMGNAPFPLVRIIENIVEEEKGAEPKEEPKVKPRKTNSKKEK